MQFNAGNAECLVFTFKEGLLSAVAHDLKLRVERFVIEWDAGARRIEARLDAASLVVVCAMRGGREDRDALSAAQRREIEDNVRRQVLASGRFPEIGFVSSEVVENEAGGGRVIGALSLCGRSRAIAFVVEAVGENRIAEVRLHQPDFGIRPYSAMLGTLRIKPEVLVRVTVRVSAGSSGS